MKREEDEKLWDVLGHSAEPAVSPFFARNVLRKVREAQSENTSRRGWALRWLVPAAGVATVIIAALTFPSHLVERPNSDSAAEVAASDSQDNDLLADLDDLVGPEDSPAWDDVVLL
jgi:anti-sigma-K factor RskA